jgi:hypothetical protein
MQGETAAHVGSHSANAAMTQNEDQMAEATIGALENLATATAADRCVVGDYFRFEGTEGFVPSGTVCQTWPKKFQHIYKQYLLNSWLQGWQDSHKPHLQHSQPWPQAEATRTDNMGGSQANKE